MSMLFSLLLIASALSVGCAAVLTGENSSKTSNKTPVLTETITVKETEVIKRAHGRFIGPDVVRSRRRVLDSDDMEHEHHEKRQIIRPVVSTVVIQRPIVVSPVITPSFTARRLVSPVIISPAVISSIGVARELVMPAQRFL
jgi:hypothetical protein